MRSTISAAVCDVLPDNARAAAESFGLLKTGNDGQLTPSRERRELEEKLRRLGFSVPWPSTT